MDSNITKPLLSMSAAYERAKEDREAMKIGRKTQRRLSRGQSGQTLHIWGDFKRALHAIETGSRTNTDTTLSDDNSATDPVSSYTVQDLKCGPLNLDGGSVVERWVYRRHQKRLDKEVKWQERRNQELERKVWRECRLDSVDVAKKQFTSPHKTSRSSVKTVVKDSLKKTKNLVHRRTKLSPEQRKVLDDLGVHIPHINDFSGKEDFRRTFLDVPAMSTATPPPIFARDVPGLAELPAAIPEYVCYSGKHLYESQNITLSPRQNGNPSTSLVEVMDSGAVLPRRGATVAEGFKQMLCDYCRNAVRITDRYYACVDCEGGQIYCSKCTHEGHTCRHELEEKTRSIKRHNTSMACVERKPIVEPSPPQKPASQSNQSSSLALKPPSDEDGAKLVVSPTISPAMANPQLQDSLFAPRPTLADHSALSDSNMAASPVSPVAGLDLFRDMEHRRREQELAFREKELMWREALTASREREDILVQQLNNTTALVYGHERKAEIGAQFFIHPGPDDTTGREGVKVVRTTSSASNTSDLSLESTCHACPPRSKLVESIAKLEATATGILASQPLVREHGASKRRADGTEASSSRATSSRAAQKQPATHNRPARQQGTGRDGGDDDNDEDGPGSPKKPRVSDSVDNNQPLFACPFWKHDPDRYSERNTNEKQYRGCAKGWFKDIPRVKQHLKRVHHCPDAYCPRCYLIFPDKTSCNHHVNEGRCEQKLENPFEERLDEDKQSRIHKKRPGMEAHKLWNLIYEIIFPGVALPDNPYATALDKWTNLQTMQLFTTLLNERLDACGGRFGQAWASERSARQFLNLQMAYSMSDAVTRMAPSPTPTPTSTPLPIAVTAVNRPEVPSRGSFSTRRPSSSILSSSPNIVGRQRPNSFLNSPLLSPNSVVGSRGRPLLTLNTSSAPDSSAVTSATTSTSARSAEPIPVPWRKNLPHLEMSRSGPSSGANSQDRQDISTIQTVPSSATSISCPQVNTVKPFGLLPPFEPPRPQHQHHQQLRCPNTLRAASSPSVASSSIAATGAVSISGTAITSIQNSSFAPQTYLPAQPRSEDHYIAYQTGQINTIDPQRLQWSTEDIFGGNRMDVDETDLVFGQDHAFLQ